MHSFRTSRLQGHRSCPVRNLLSAILSYSHERSTTAAEASCRSGDARDERYGCTDRRKQMEG